MLPYLRLFAWLSLPTKGRRDECTWLRTHAPTSVLSSLATSIQPSRATLRADLHTVISKCGRKEMQPSASAEVRIHHMDLRGYGTPQTRRDADPRLPQLCFCGSLPRWKNISLTRRSSSRSWSRRGRRPAGAPSAIGLASWHICVGPHRSKVGQCPPHCASRMHRGRRRASAIRPQRGSPRPAVRGNTGPTGGRAGGLQHAA